MKVLKKLCILVLVFFVIGCQTPNNETVRAQDFDFDFDLNEDYAYAITEATANGDYDKAKHYDILRSRKKEYSCIQDDFTFDNLLLLSKIVHAEAGSNWLTEEHRQLVASVVINRVKSSKFPNSIYDVIYQRGQYAPVWSGYFENLIPSKACVYSASEVLANGSIAPDNVVFQANFVQGSGVYKCIYDNILGATYFCY